MRTKFIKIAILGFLMAGTLPSCNKDFLNRNPLDAASSETFWTSDGDVQQALTGVYQTLQNGFYNWHKVWLDAYSDNAYDRFDYFGFQELTQGIVNNTDINTNFYNPPYANIARCNYFLDNISKAPITPAALAEYTAEVRFLRAMYYFDLVQAYGGVVLYTTQPTSVAASKVPKTSKDDVLKFVNAELDFAIANLPDAAYAGHAVKASAEAEKARVALYQNDWATAAALTNTIITSGKFSLCVDYAAMFNNTASQQTNPEIIFSTKYLRPSAVSNSQTEIGGYGAVGPYQNLVDEYETTSGKMITESGSGYDPAHPYVNRDPRLGYTIQVPTDTIHVNGSVWHQTDPLLTGYAQKKYVDFDDVQKSQVSDENIIHTRYADVLLMYAEAKNEVSGPDASIYAALDQIRQRPSVNMPPVDEAKYDSQASLRDFIRHERRVELALEGFRYYDLKRWNIMEEKLSAIKNPGGVQLKFGEINNVLPFSLDELTKNPKLVQNEGYQ